MITIERITGKFLHYYGLGSTRSNLDIRPIFPYLLMDAGYQFYDKQLFKRKKNHVFKHEVAKHVGNLGTAFHEYFQTLFVVFGERSDERDEIIDMMDRYGKFMEHDLQILLYSAMDCFMNDFNMEEETVLGSTLVLNSLADISRGIWKDAVADDLKKGQAYQFKPGTNNRMRNGAVNERHRVISCTISRRETFRKERARVKAGLPQLTKLHVRCEPKGKAQIRFF